MQEQPPLWKQILGALTGATVALVGYVGYTSIPTVIAFASNAFSGEDTLIARLVPEFQKPHTRSQQDLATSSHTSSTQGTASVSTGESATLLAAPSEESALPSEEELTEESLPTTPVPSSLLMEEEENTESPNLAAKQGDTIPPALIEEKTQEPASPMAAAVEGRGASPQGNPPVPALPSTGPEVYLAFMLASAAAWVQKKRRAAEGGIR